MQIQTRYNTVLLKSLVILAIISCLFSCTKLDYTDVQNHAIMLEQDSCFISLPNAFTPNNDGRNDLLRVFHNGISTINYELKIYKDNYRRKEVYATTNINDAWDGGKEKSGQYIALIKGTFECGESFIQYAYISVFTDCVPLSDVADLSFENNYDPITNSFIFPTNEEICP